MSTKELVRSNPVRNAAGWCLPQNVGATTFTVNGQTAPATTGTLTAASYATTNAQTKANRVEYLVTTPSTTAVAGQRFAQQHVTPGNGSGAGGFRFCMIGGPATGMSVGTRRFFMGLRASGSAPTDVDPSSLSLIVGLAYDDTDSNLQVMYNDGSGTASKADTGWARPSADRTGWYMFEAWSEPSSTDIWYRVTDLENDNVVTGRLTTNIPAYGNWLAPRTHSSVGGTSGVTGVAVGGVWFEGE